MNIGNLQRDDRMRLLKFVISFAWADLEIRDKERAFVRKLANELEITAEDALLVDAWLTVPPRPEEVDPNDIPDGHKKLVLDLAKKMVKADGEVSDEERDHLSLLTQMLSG